MLTHTRTQKTLIHTNFVLILRNLYSIDSRLIGLEFYIEGKLEKSKSEIEKAIKEMKGTVGHFIGRKTAAVFSSAENVKAMGPYMQNAKEIGIQVVPVDFLDAVKFSDPFSLIKDMNLSPWECIDVSGLLSFFNKEDFYQMQKKNLSHLAKSTDPTRWHFSVKTG